MIPHLNLMNVNHTRRSKVNIGRTKSITQSTLKALAKSTYSRHINVCAVGLKSLIPCSYRLASHDAKIYNGTKQRNQLQFCNHYFDFFSAIVIGLAVPR